MPLKITLKPQEKILIGGAVVQNGNVVAELSILSDVQLLREKDILTEQGATSACKRIYFLVQLMYIDQANLAIYQRSYKDIVSDAVSSVPGAVNYIASINNEIALGRYYQALKKARKLINYEQELVNDSVKVD
jgi:flagellar protein FlbT